MTPIEGIVVLLRTQNAQWAGTDDHIYVGIVGTGGGGEFPLDVHGFDDFERGEKVTYWFGDVWEGHLLTAAKNPHLSQDQTSAGWNDPGRRGIDLDKVDFVYLRKESHWAGDEDDRWGMEDVDVILYGPAHPLSRTFRKTGDIWLANEAGLEVYLKEQ